MKTKGILLIACFAVFLHDANCSPLDELDRVKPGLTLEGYYNSKYASSEESLAEVPHELWGIEKPPADLNDYEPEKKIGQGSYGDIILAKHKTTVQEVAIKIMDVKKMKGQFVADEAKIMKKLDHKNILKVLDVIKTKKTIYLVMEYAPGGDLLEYLHKRRYLDEEDARAFFRQMMEAAEYCHYMKIAHRDLKLENFLLDKEGNIKLTDFGIAAEFKTNGKLNGFYGTPEYRAPEIQPNKDYNGPKADVYSLGVCLFGMVTGHVPYDENGEYLQPFFVSSEFEVFVKTLIKKDPKDRHTLQDIMSNGPNEWLNEDFPKLKPYAELVH